jgi:hypothetical protein
LNAFEAVLAGATLIGGAAGIWYFVREFRTIKWSRPVFRRAAHGAPRLADGDLPFPLAVIEAVERCVPGWRLPGVRDLHGDWGEYLDFPMLGPLLCTGDFTGSGGTEYAVFVLGNDERRPSYKVLALTSESGDLVAHELLAGEHEPQNMFVKTMDAGYYRRSELVRGDGEPSVVHLKRQGISLGTFESAASLVYWDGQKFKQVWMSD